MEKEVLTKNILVTGGGLIASTLMAIAFSHFSLNSTSVAVIYVLAVMLIARYTTGYVPGIVASIIGVFCVN